MNNNKEVLVFGHYNADVDSVMSALIFADFLRRTNVNAKAYRLSELDNETKFVLQTAGIKPPDQLPDDIPDGTQVALVDHNEQQHSMKNLKNMRVLYVIDHHKLGDLTTVEPVFVRFEPVGSTATILRKLYREHQIEIDEKIALLIVSAIISDTLYFRLSTTTEDDRSTLNNLLPIVKIDNVQSYAYQMFAAQSNFSGFSMREILHLGYKDFIFNNQYWGVSLLYTIRPHDLLSRKDEMLKEMTNDKTNSNLTGILFSVVDIFKEQHFMFIVGESERTVVETTFNVTIHSHIADLGARISRKKDIIPALEAYFRTHV